MPPGGESPRALPKAKQSTHIIGANTMEILLTSPYDFAGGIPQNTGAVVTQTVVIMR